MQDIDYTSEQEHHFSDSVAELQRINKQLAKLLVRKEELTNDIIAALEHSHEGQKTYEYNIWKIEVRTPVIYSLNKKMYESGKISLPMEYNPIKESISYSIDKRLCEQYMLEAPKKIRDALTEIIDKKPGKANIVIKERI